MAVYFKSISLVLIIYTFTASSSSSSPDEPRSESASVAPMELEEQDLQSSQKTQTASSPAAALTAKRKAECGKYYSTRVSERTRCSFISLCKQMPNFKAPQPARKPRSPPSLHQVFSSIHAASSSTGPRISCSKTSSPRSNVSFLFIPHRKLTVCIPQNAWSSKSIFRSEASLSRPFQTNTTPPWPRLYTSRKSPPCLPGL